MVTVIQRVSASRVEINGNIQGEIAQGLMILLGVKTGDTLEDAAFLAKKSPICAFLKMKKER